MLPTPPLRPVVLCVDDDPEVLEGLTHTLRSLPCTLMTAGSVPSAVEVLYRQHVDVLMTDDQMPDGGGAAMLQRCSDLSPRTVKLVLTGHPSLQTAVRSINEFGVFRFLEKPCPPEVLRRTVEQALAHGREAAAAPLPKDTPTLSTELRRQLTPREAEIVEQVVSGASTSQIAKQLFISTHTVRNHLKAIFKKLNVHSRGELVNLSLRRESPSTQPS